MLKPIYGTQSPRLYFSNIVICSFNKKCAPTASSNDPSISADMKEKLIADINQQQSQLTNEKNRTIAPYNKDRNDKILTKQIKSIEKKAKKMFGKAIKVNRRTRDQAGEDFVEFNGESGSRDAGKLRQEGKDYIVKDGDVMHFLFNV